MSQSEAVPTAYDAQFAFRMLFTLGPTIEAIMLWGIGAINLFWSSVFGIGGHIIEWYVPHEGTSPLHLLGIFVWPVAVWAGLYLLSGCVWQLSYRTRIAAMAAFVGSLLVVVPMDGVIYGPFKYESLPLFIRLLTY